MSYEERAAKILKGLQERLTREGWTDRFGMMLAAGPFRAIIVYKNRITAMTFPERRESGPIEFETAVTWLAEELRDIDFWNAYHEAKAAKK